MLILERPWTRQPDLHQLALLENLYSAGGDYTSPSYGSAYDDTKSPMLGAGCLNDPALVLTGAGGVSLIGGERAVTQFGVGLRPTPSGSTGTGGWIVPAFGKARATYPAYQSSPAIFTAGIAFSKDSLTMSASSPMHVCGMSGDFTGRSFAAVYISPTGWEGPALSIRHSTSAGDASIALYVGGPGTQVGTLYELFYGCDGTRLWAFCNGVFASTTSSVNSTGVWNVDTSQYCIGGSTGRRTFAEAALRGVIYWHFMAPSVAVPAEKFLRYAQRRWSIFEGRRIPIPSAAAAATAPTITALSAIGITATSAQPRITYA